jgi:hypothetical protein
MLLSYKYSSYISSHYHFELCDLYQHRYRDTLLVYTSLTHFTGRPKTTSFLRNSLKYILNHS